MGYFSELRAHWRPLLAALIGFGSGLSFTTTTASIMGPHLIGDLGWARSDFAAVSSMVIVMLITMPIIGRLTDVIGVRRTALIGVVTLPLTFLVLASMTGGIETYVAMILIQTVVCGTTTATVYSRIVVQYITKARGLALAIVASGPALSGVFLSPLLNDFVADNGWRAGYVALAVFTATMGALALIMLPAEKKDGATRAHIKATKSDYAMIAKSGAFWLIVIGMLLCNLPQVIALSQLNLVLGENGVAPADTGVMLSAVATGMLIGRFACGVALDRFSASIIAFISMGLPSVGLFLLASGFDAPIVLTIAVFAIGLSYGAEGDLLGFLVVRHFGVRIYSTVLGMVTAVIAFSISLGAMLLSFTLARTESYAPFMTWVGAAVLIGSVLFLLLRKPVTAPSEQPRISSAPAPETQVGTSL